MTPTEAASAAAVLDMASTSQRVYVGPEVDKGLCLIRAVVRSPSYRIQMRKGEVQAMTESQILVGVDDKVTRPCWKWDQHEIFKTLEENGREVEAVLDRYSVPDASRSERMVAVLKAPELILKIQEVRERRMCLVNDLMENLWFTEVLPQLRTHFGELFYQIKGLLPKPESFTERYEIETVVRALTPLTPDDMDLSMLSEADQRKLVFSQQDTIAKMYADRFGTLFEKLFGEVVEICESICHGPVGPDGQRTGKSAIETGKRKSGALIEIMDVLDRVKNFQQFASPEVLTMVNNVQDLIHKTDIQALNANKGVNEITAALKSAMQPLGRAVKSLWEARRDQATRSIKV